MNPLKIPKYLLVPVQNRHEIYGIKRACRVIDIQAKIFKDKWFLTQYETLDNASKALKASINKENPIAESVSLKWIKQ